MLVSFFFLLDKSFFKNLINQKKGPLLSKYNMYSYYCIHTLCKYRGGFIRQTNSCLQGKFSDKRERLRERWLCETHNITHFTKDFRSCKTWNGVTGRWVLGFTSKNAHQMCMLMWEEDSFNIITKSNPCILWSLKLKEVHRSNPWSKNVTKPTCIITHIVRPTEIC